MESEIFGNLNLLVGQDFEVTIGVLIYREAQLYEF